MFRCCSVEDLLYLLILFVSLTKVFLIMFVWHKWSLRRIRMCMDDGSRGSHFPTTLSTCSTEIWICGTNEEAEWPYGRMHLLARDKVFISVRCVGIYSLYTCKVSVLKEMFWRNEWLHSNCVSYYNVINDFAVHGHRHYRWER